MLKTLEIKNFRSIADAGLAFGRVNLFIGANGSGKTSILEAVGVVASALSGGVESIDLDNAGIRWVRPQLFSARFRNILRRIEFKISASTEGATYQIAFQEANGLGEDLELSQENIGFLIGTVSLAARLS